MGVAVVNRKARESLIEKVEEVRDQALKYLVKEHAPLRELEAQKS